MERIEGLFDGTVASSLDATVTDGVQGHLRRYLADAHALEAQSIQLLESGMDQADEVAPLGAAFREHLAESRGQQEALEARLDALGGDPSSLKDVALRIGGLTWAAFFRAHPDTPGKLAGFAYAFEHLEIGGYEQLRRVAERAGDAATAELAGRILAEERSAAETLKGAFGPAVEASLAEQVG